MPRAKNIEAYPPAYARIIEEGILRQIEIPMATEKDARRLMGKLYAYFGALHECAKPIESSPEIKALSKMARRVQLRLNGPVLIARPQDQDPDAQLILQALGGEHSLLSSPPPNAPTSPGQSWAVTAQANAASNPQPSEFLRSLVKTKT